MSSHVMRVDLEYNTIYPFVLLYTNYVVIYIIKNFVRLNILKYVSKIETSGRSTTIGQTLLLERLILGRHGATVLAC